MSVLQKIAFYQNRRDEVPNQELARELAMTGDTAGIQEIADNLWNKNKNVHSDCLKVLYEIGYLRPELIAAYAEDFIKLLSSKNNRMVWGAMIGLSTVAGLRADAVWEHKAEIMRVIDNGSVITVVNGVKVLAGAAAANAEYCAGLMPFLLKQMQGCIPRDVPVHAESILPAVDAGNKDAVLAVINARMAEFSPAQLTRVRRVVKRMAEIA
ncbi:MAG TPA: hypothetical protein PLP19_02890 [bacterium]|nr:hypothetical protein [bacterium]HPN42413.1 hypothetical protein [bacterium]